MTTWDVEGPVLWMVMFAVDAGFAYQMAAVWAAQERVLVAYVSVEYSPDDCFADAFDVLATEVQR